MQCMGNEMYEKVKSNIEQLFRLFPDFPYIWNLKIKN